MPLPFLAVIWVFPRLFLFMTEIVKEPDGSKFCSLRNPAEGSLLLNLIVVSYRLRPGAQAWPGTSNLWLYTIQRPVAPQNFLWSSCEPHLDHTSQWALHGCWLLPSSPILASFFSPFLSVRQRFHSPTPTSQMEGRGRVMMLQILSGLWNKKRGK